MIDLQLLALGACILLLLQVVAFVEARTRARPAAPRSGVAPSPRRLGSAAIRRLDGADTAWAPDRPRPGLVHA
jgi:hypothetical protein